MNIKEELAKELLTIVQESQNGVAKGIDFAYQEAPLVVNEILLFNMVKHGVSALLCLVPFFLLRFFLKKAKELEESSKAFSHSTEDAFYFCGMIILFFLSVICSISFIEEIFSLFKILLSPRSYLIEYLSGLVS